MDGIARKSRRPLTGRSNLHQINSSGEITRSRQYLNDTLRITQPLSPKDPYFKDPEVVPPILPKSIFPTVPEYEEVEKRKRPLTCPTKWIEQSQKPDLFDKSSMMTNIDDDTKQKICRSFIERNRNQLWKYNTDYLKKTPRTIYKDIITDTHFIGIMTKIHTKERFLTLGSSEGLRKSLIITSDEGLKSNRNFDPYSASLTTTRMERDRKYQELSMHGMIVKDFRRGYDHAPEYGNFSKYNSVLKTNQSSIIKR